MKNNLLLIIFTIGILVRGTPVVRADGDLTIGWIGPLTGDAAALGVDSVEVARRVFDDFNKAAGEKKPKLKFVAEDDQYKTAKTVSAYNKLVHIEGAKVIFVLTYGGLLAIADKAQKDDVLLIDPLDCDDQLAALPKNTFCIAKRTEDLGIRNALHAIKHKNFPAAIIYFDGDPFPAKVAQATKDTLEKSGIKVTSFEGVSTGTRDFRSILTKIKQQGAKALFVYGYDDFGLALKQARDIGLGSAIYSVPGAGINNPGFNAGAGDAINGTYAAGWFAPRTAAYLAFLADYKQKIGREPILEVSTVPTYDSAKLLTLAIDKTIGEEDTLRLDSVREYFYGIKDYTGLSGTITMDQDGAVRTLRIGMYSFNHGNFKNEE